MDEQKQEKQDLAFRQAILDAAGGEMIEAVVWGEEPEPEILYPSGLPAPAAHLNRVLSWDEGFDLLICAERFYGYDGFQPFTAWTANRVIFCWACEDEVRVKWLPRNPADHTPSFW